MPAIRSCDVTESQMSIIEHHSPAWPVVYAATRARVSALLADAGVDDASATVPACPAWTVRDVVAHVGGLAVALSTGAGPGAGDVQGWLDALVDARRDRSLAELLDEWQRASAGIEVTLTHMGAGGGQLVYDVVAHEHDIRHALGRGGARDSTSVVACATAMSALLARDLAAHGLPAVRITSGGRTWDVGEGDHGLAVTLDPFELIRVFGGRRSLAQLRAIDWHGDLDRYLPALAHFPLPDRDLVE